MHTEQTRAASLIHPVALVYLEETEPAYQIEMVDTVLVEGGYQITTIPFFAKHLALNDIISVENDEGVHYFEDLLVKSGHSVIRVIFASEQLLDDAMVALEQLGAIAFRYADSILVAFDVPATVDYVPIQRYLTEGQAENKWEYEEACLGWK